MTVNDGTTAAAATTTSFATATAMTTQPIIRAPFATHENRLRIHHHTQRQSRIRECVIVAHYHRY
jgi:hypothetical protein